jgi:hypothetical protein
MYANQKTVIHNFLLFKEFAIPVYLPASPYENTFIEMMDKNAKISEGTNQTPYVEH